MRQKMIYSLLKAPLYQRHACRWWRGAGSLKVADGDTEAACALCPSLPLCFFILYNAAQKQNVANDATQVHRWRVPDPTPPFTGPFKSGGLKLPIALLLKYTELIRTDPYICHTARINMKTELFSWNMKIRDESCHSCLTVLR